MTRADTIVLEGTDETTDKVASVDQCHKVVRVSGIDQDLQMVSKQERLLSQGVPTGLWGS